jgi:hypothetical protein
MELKFLNYIDNGWEVSLMVCIAFDMQLVENCNVKLEKEEKK